MSEWLRRFEGKRQIVQRRPPSYLTPPVNNDLLEEQPEEPLDTKDMIAYDKQELDLSAIPTRRSQNNRQA